MTIEERLDRIEKALSVLVELPPDDVPPADAPPVAPEEDPAVRDLEEGNRINAARRQAEADAINAKEGH